MGQRSNKAATLGVDVLLNALAGTVADGTGAPLVPIYFLFLPPPPLPFLDAPQPPRPRPPPPPPTVLLVLFAAAPVLTARCVVPFVLTFPGCIPMRLCGCCLNGTSGGWTWGVPSDRCPRGSLVRGSHRRTLSSRRPRAVPGRSVVPSTSGCARTARCCRVPWRSASSASLTRKQR